MNDNFLFHCYLYNLFVVFYVNLYVFFNFIRLNLDWLILFWVNFFMFNLFKSIVSDFRNILKIDL